MNSLLHLIGCMIAALLIAIQGDEYGDALINGYNGLFYAMLVALFGALYHLFILFQAMADAVLEQDDEPA